jgi:hypothetical protein
LRCFSAWRRGVTVISNVWRARARWLEMNFYAPIFTGEARDDGWQAVLARDYTAPRHHISFVRAAGRRLRRDYVWILAVQVIAYCSKIAIHPTPAATLAEFSDRAAVGPISGWVVLIVGFIYNFGPVGVRARHDVARPARARGQGRRGGDGVMTARKSRDASATPARGAAREHCLSVGGARGESCDNRRRMQLMGCEIAGNQDQSRSEHQS